MKIRVINSVVIAAALFAAGCEMNNANANNQNSNVNRMTAATATTTPTPNRSNPTREEYDKNRADYEKDKGSSSIGQGIDDSWLWFKTRTALAAESDLRDSTINVDSVNSVITLRGTVANASQKARAETIAKGIAGVKSVNNQLQVKPSDSMTNQVVNGNKAANKYK
jgi:hypothetical protein